jgi:hypothetical protein
MLLAKRLRQLPGGGDLGERLGDPCSKSSPFIVVGMGRDEDAAFSPWLSSSLSSR